MNRKLMNEQPLVEIEIVCNIIDVFTVNFDQFNASLHNAFLSKPTTNQGCALKKANSQF